MPHLTLQYTINLVGADAAALLTAINRAAVASGLFEPGDIKTRAIPLSLFQNGLPEDSSGFVHLSVAMAEREAQQEKALAAALADAVQESLPKNPGVSLQLCVEIVHVDTTRYVKRTLAHQR